MVVGWLLHKTYYHKTLFFICFFILIFYCSKQLNNNIKHWYFILPYKRSIRVNPINPCSKKLRLNEHGFIGYNGYYQSWYCLPDSITSISFSNPETASRVTLATLGTGFQPDLIGCLWIKHQYKKNIFVYFYLLIFYSSTKPPISISPLFNIC